MRAKVYEDMLQVMMKRGGPYAGADIPEFYELVETLFSPAEAEINNVLSRNPVPAAVVAGQIGKNEGEVRGLLEGMVGKGLCSCFTADGKTQYQGVPFMPGIFEYLFMGGKVGEREKRIARLIHAYKAAYIVARGDAKITFPLTRVIPVDRKIPVKNAVHTYDQVASYIGK